MTTKKARRRVRFERSTDCCVDGDSGHAQSTTKKVKRRVRRRTTIAEPAPPSSPYYEALTDIAQGIDAEQVRSLLRLAQSRGFDVGTIDDFLIDFDWEAALQLLPYLMEYAETLNNAESAEKEKQTLALLLRIAELAGVDAMFDEHAVATLRIVIEKLAEVSKGQYRINLGRLARLVKASGSWMLRHCACARNSG